MRITLILISIFFTLNICSCQNGVNKPKTSIDYYELGIPDINNEWTETDLQKTFDVLKVLKKTDTFSLPKLDDKKSSAIFNKIINSLPKVNSQDTLNLIEQFNNYRAFKKTLPDLFGLYGGASESEQKFYSNEAIEILKRVLVETTNSTELYFEYYSTGLEDSIDNRTKAKQINGGSFKIFTASLNMNDSNNRYNLKDKLELAETVSLNLKKVWKNMGEDYRYELLKKVKYYSKESEFTEVRKVFSKLAMELIERK